VAAKEEKMDVSLILRVAGVGILVAIAAQILSKSGRDEQATLVTVAGLVVVFLMLVQEIGRLFDTVRGIFGF
jgi:stage III sporulation protein AC